MSAAAGVLAQFGQRLLAALAIPPMNEDGGADRASSLASPRPSPSVAPVTRIVWSASAVSSLNGRPDLGWRERAGGVNGFA